MMNMSRTFLSQWLGVLLVAIVALSGCDKSWWNRGQPPSVGTLVERSQQDLRNALAKYRADRNDIATNAEQIGTDLGAAVKAANQGSPKAQVLDPLHKATTEMIALENHLSIGSRAAYGELSGQLRLLVEKLEQGEDPNAEAIGLYSSRVLFFLANELTVPAPVA